MHCVREVQPRLPIKTDQRQDELCHDSHQPEPGIGQQHHAADGRLHQRLDGLVETAPLEVDQAATFGVDRHVTVAHPAGARLRIEEHLAA